jgi:hypothetical protein
MSKTSESPISKEQENREIYLSNLNNLMVLHNNLKTDYIFDGILNTSRVENFVNILIDNIYFIKENKEENEDEEFDLNSILYNEK